MRGGTIESAFPYVAPDRCLHRQRVVGIQRVVHVQAHHQLVSLPTGITFSKRRLMRLVLARRSVPMGSTFNKIDGNRLTGAAKDTCRAHAVLLRFS